MKRREFLLSLLAVVLVKRRADPMDGWIDFGRRVSARLLHGDYRLIPYGDGTRSH